MGDSTKERIIDAAQTILRQFGVEGLTVEAAADLAGVARKTVYNHFENRFALIDEAATAWTSGVLLSLESIAQDGATPFALKLNAIVERGFAELRSGGRLLIGSRRDGLRKEALNRELLAASDPDSANHGPAGIARIQGELRRSLRKLIERIVADAAGAGLIRSDYDPKRLTWVLINIIEGMIFLEGMDNEPFSKADLLRDSLRAVVSGILSPEGFSAMRDSSLFEGGV